MAVLARKSDSFVSSMILFVGMLFLSCPAAPSNKVGGSCSTKGEKSSVGTYIGLIGMPVLTCTDGRWIKSGEDAKSEITITMKIMEDDKLIMSTGVTTLDGQQQRINDKHEYNVSGVHGAVKVGSDVQMTPVINDEDKIVLSLSLVRNEITGVSMGAPVISLLSIKKDIALESGKEVTLPFGSAMSGKNNEQKLTKYTVALIATKIK